MIPLLLLATAALLVVLLSVITLVQILCMESLRLRAREFPAMVFFRESLEDKIGVDTQRGALAFSLTKHTLLLVLVLVVLLLTESLFETALFGWLAMLAATYIVPQLLYRKTSGHWLLAFVPAFRLIVVLLTPLTSILGFFESLVELGKPDPAGIEESNASDHIEAFISAGEEEGILEEDDRRLIQSVVEFGDKTVREVMTPRPNIVAIAQGRSLEDLRQLVIHEQYSRIPVYENSIDQVVGFVHVRDMFELEAQDRKDGNIRDLMRPMRHVPETKPVNDLLREMQHDGAHMVIVVDEYGNTAGLATMEDLVEEILGEIHDEHEPDRDVKEESEGAFLVAGSLDLDRLQDLLSFRPQEETESTTVGGLVTEWLGHVPHAGESLEREGIRIEVLASNELRVEQVRVSKAEKNV